MAGIKATATTEGEIALTGAVAKTILMLVAAASVRVGVRSWGVSFDGTTAAAEPVQVDLYIPTSAGTSSPGTPVKDGDPGAETLQTTSRFNCTAEPTGTIVLRRMEIHPQGGNYERVFDVGEMMIPGGTRLGIRCTAPSGVNCLGFMAFEE